MDETIKSELDNFFSLEELQSYLDSESSSEYIVTNFDKELCESENINISSKLLELCKTLSLLLIHTYTQQKESNSGVNTVKLSRLSKLILKLKESEFQDVKFYSRKSVDNDFKTNHPPFSITDEVTELIIEGFNSLYGGIAEGANESLEQLASIEFSNRQKASFSRQSDLSVFVKKTIRKFIDHLCQKHQSNERDVKSILYHYLSSTLDLDEYDGVKPYAKISRFIKPY